MIDLDKAKAAYAATLKLRLSNMGAIDLKDRLAIITVVAGLRNSGLLEGEGLEQTEVRKALIDAGIATLRAEGVWARVERPATTTYLSARSIIDKFAAQSELPVLWIFSKQEHRTILREQRFTLSRQEVGRILGYPECCIDHDTAVALKEEDRRLDAIRDHFGDEEGAVEKAVRERSFSMMEDDISLLGNVPQTDLKFPFVQHIACDSCLIDDASPSAELNRTYAGLAQDVNPKLHQAIIRMGALTFEWGVGKNDAIAKQRLAIEMERTHRSVVG